MYTLDKSRYNVYTGYSKGSFMKGKTVLMRAEQVDKQALALFAAEVTLATGSQPTTAEALHEFIAKYRPDLIEKAAQQLKSSKAKSDQK
jgi:hypothetical protein